jgi:hypothetical protein
MNPVEPTFPKPTDPDYYKGAVEGDRPTDIQQGNENVPGSLDSNGLPSDKVKIAEDAIGAKVDGSEGG